MLRTFAASPPSFFSVFLSSFLFLKVTSVKRDNLWGIHLHWWYGRAKQTLRLGIVLLLFFLFIASAFIQETRGQSRPRSIYGIGGQIGEPSGISYKRFFMVGYAVDLLAAWDLNESFLAGIHVVNEQPIPDSALNMYLGPGMYAGLTHTNKRAQLRTGFSIQAGLNFYSRRFEVFLQTTPTFDLVPRQTLGLGGSVGLRYYPIPKRNNRLQSH